MAIVKQYDKRRKVTYVYDSVSTWIPELGQPRAKRKLIGRLDENGNIVPTGRRGRPKKDDSRVTADPKQPEERLAEENSRMREEILRAKQEIEELTQTVKGLKNQNERLTKSILKMSSIVSQINKEMAQSLSLISTNES